MPRKQRLDRLYPVDPAKRIRPFLGLGGVMPAGLLRQHPPQPVQQLTLAKYIDLWLTDIAPGKLAKSTIRRDRQDIERILPALGHYKLTELRPEHFRNFYAELRKVIRPDTKKPLSEYTIEGVHATLCSILSDAVEGGFLSHNPAWRTYRYAGRKCEKKIAE